MGSYSFPFQRMVSGWKTFKQTIYPILPGKVKMHIDISAKPNLRIKLVLGGDFTKYSMQIQYRIRYGNDVIAETKKPKTIPFTRTIPKYVINTKWLPPGKNDKINAEFTFVHKSESVSSPIKSPVLQSTKSFVNPQTQRDIERISNFSFSSSRFTAPKSPEISPPSPRKKFELSPLPSTEFDIPNGLRNQGSTCYMNSYIQTLFHLPIFRSKIYQITTGTEFIKSLQSLFCWLQLSKRSPGSTVSLTKSLGWSTQETNQQQDAQEFLHFFMRAIEKETITNVRREIFDLFRISVRMYVRGASGYESNSIEEMLDLILPVKDSNNLEESLERYVSPEKIDDYNTGKSIEQATLGTEFVKLPPILFLNLSRYEFDVEQGKMIKINSKFSFPESINLSSILAENNGHKGSTEYELFGVLVHSGSATSGHYYALLRIEPENHRWFKFNDSSVTEIDEERVIKDYTGGTTQIEKTYSAYMLVYCQKSSLHEIFFQVPDSLIPFASKEEFKRSSKEMKKVSNYDDSTVKVASFFTLRNLSSKLITTLQKHCKPLKIKIKNEAFTVAELIHMLSEQFLLPPERCRLWLCTDEYRLIRPIADGIVQKLPSRNFFLEKIREKSTNVSGTLLNLYVFVPFCESPIYFVMSALMEPESTLRDAGRYVLRELGLSDQDLTPYARASFVGFQQVSDKVSIRDLPTLINGSAIIFEGIADIPDEFSLSSSSEVTDNYYFRKEFPSKMPASLVEYMKVVSSDIRFEVARHQRNLILHIHPTATAEELLSFIGKTTGKGFTPNVSKLLLFKKGESLPIEANPSQTAAEILGRATSLRVKVVSASSPFEYRQVTVVVSDRLFVKTKTFDVIVTSDEEVTKLLQKAKNKGFLKHDEEPRIFAIKDHRIVDILQNESEIGEIDAVRFETFSDDNYPTSDDDFFIQIVHCKLPEKRGGVDEKDHAFFFKLFPEETLLHFRNRFEPLLKYPPEQLKLLQYLVVDEGGQRTLLHEDDIVAKYVDKGGVLDVAHLCARPLSPYRKP